MAVSTNDKAEVFIRRSLDAARTKWVTTQFFEALFKTIGITAIVLLVAFLADNAFALPGVLRLLLLGVVITLFFGGIGYSIYNLAMNSPSDEAMARIIEKKYPDFDNRIINSIQLAKSEHAASSGAIVSALVSTTAETVSKFNFKGIVSAAKLRKLGILAAVGVLLFSAYAVGLPQNFENALERFVKPLAYVPPLTDTQLTVEPGDTTVGYGRPITVIGRVSGVVPPNAVISFRARGQGKFIAQEMEFNGREFAHHFSSVTEDIEYFVEAGDARSQIYTLDAVVLPVITSLSLAFEFPAFTNLDKKVLTNAGGSVTAPIGTNVTVTGEANVTLSKVEFEFGDNRTVTVPPTGKTFSSTFKVTRNSWYSITLWDMEGVRNEAPPKYTIAVQPDAPPQVRIIRPEADLTTSPEREVLIAFQASDDFGLSYIELAYRLNAAEEKCADKWVLEKGTKLVVDQFVWKLSEFGFKPGDKVSWFLRVKDSGANEPILSRVMNLLIVSEEELRNRQGGLMEDIQTKLAELLRMQQDAKRTSDSIQAALDSGDEENFNPSCETLTGKQESVRLRCKSIIGELTDPIFETLLIKPTLQRLYSGAMVNVMEQISALKAAAFTENRKKNLSVVALTQDEIIRELQKLLDRMPAIISQLAEGKSAEQISEEFPEKKMQWYRDQLKEFIEQQRKAIEMTRELERIPPEDWTDREREMAKELEAMEEKWQKFFEEHRDDFSKLPFQDFSGDKMADEFVEVIAAVTVAYDAIKNGNFDIAVPVEQAGLEKAEKIMHNLEAWVTDTPDREKWSMEEATNQEEIPMAELPDELEDLVGDLIEEEEDMADDIEDISSSWADSIDEGAGWDTMDGPISSMSAKGKTGNRLPNKSEIGGRSGEGRSGKSSGQFVEKNATGKGGRETPTRLTKDPYEAGEVNDTSQDPVSGSTGGGKVSGQGGEGLQGAPPPEIQKEMGRLAGQQAELMSRAEGLLHELRKRHYPTREVEKAIADLKEIEKQLREGAHGDLTSKVRSVVEKLRDAQKTIDEQTRINREKQRRVPERDRDGMSGTSDDKMPSEYQELIEEYYRSLAEEEANGGGN